MRQVVAAVNSALGGQAQVLRAGSQKKHTHVTTRSDLDVVVKTPEPLTLEAQRALGDALAAKFPDSRVVTGAWLRIPDGSPHCAPLGWLLVGCIMSVGSFIWLA